MKFGFVSAILPDQSLEDVIRFAAAEGFDCVELMCWPRGKAERRYAGVTHLDVDAFTEAEASKVRELAEGPGVAIGGLGYYPNPLAPDEAEAAGLRRAPGEGHPRGGEAGRAGREHVHRPRLDAVGRR